jgi:hypothetical protein
MRRGLSCVDFCQHALAYMTQQPLEEFEKKSTAEMRVVLLLSFMRKPWLLILDGLERVLVAYHRIDAAEVRDEELNRPTDNILDRNPAMPSAMRTPICSARSPPPRPPRSSSAPDSYHACC